MALSIRPYRPADRAAVGQICVKTGASGNDATGHFASDELLPAVYAYPYVDFAPDLAWVVQTDEGEAIGYILGAADARELAQWWEREWLPVYNDLLPVDDSWGEGDLSLRKNGADPGHLLHQHVEDYPALFHIDLLPEAQGGGLGRKLVTTFCAALAQRGVHSLAIGVAADNESAVGFYRRLGFEEIARNESDGKVDSYMMGLDVDAYLSH